VIRIGSDPLGSGSIRIRSGWIRIQTDWIFADPDQSGSSFSDTDRIGSSLNPDSIRIKKKNIFFQLIIDLNSKNLISACFCQKKKFFTDFSLKTHKTRFNGQILSKLPDYGTKMIALKFYTKWH
jgi:hypothetical protein